MLTIVSAMVHYVCGQSRDESGVLLFCLLGGKVA
jgi:hypothetical protein